MTADSIAAPSVTDGAITAVIVDDHVAIAAGVHYWCERAAPPIGLVDAQGRLADVWTGPGATADVVVFDLELVPGKPEFGELRRLVDSGRRVVVYSQHTDNATAIKCIDLGALAYLTKREGPQHLVSAIRAAAQGRSYIPPSLSGALIADDAADRPRLSPREMQVLRAWFASSSKDVPVPLLGQTQICATVPVSLSPFGGSGSAVSGEHPTRSRAGTSPAVRRSGRRQRRRARRIGLDLSDILRYWRARWIR